MEELMHVLSIKNILKSGRKNISGVIIQFKTKEVLQTNYVYILEEECKKYFQIVDVSCDTSSDQILYKAVECGYGQDKVSNKRYPEIRNFLNASVFELNSEEEIKDLGKRSCYT